MAFDFKKEYKEFYMPKNKPEIVTVPKANYIAVRGKGNPNEIDGAYQKAISIGVEEYLLKPVDYDELKAMAARIAGEIHARKEKQQEIRDMKKYFNRSVPELRSKFVGNLLYGRIQGKGVMQEQAESLNLTIDKYIVCVGRKVVGENRIHAGDKWVEEFACINIFEEIFNNFGIQVLSDYNTAAPEYF